MIVVVEGADGTGKTTLARACVDHFGERRSTYLHSTYAEDQWALDAGLLRSAVTAHLRGELAVLDRHWVGDNVYGATFRGRTGVWVRRMDSVLRRYGALYVLAAPPVEVVERLFAQVNAERSEMYASVTEVARRYRELYRGTGRPSGSADSYVEQEAAAGGWARRDDVLGYDRTLWRKPPAALVLDRARALELTVEPYDPLGLNLAGKPGPDVTLLAGDRLARAEDLTWPFFANDNCSAYLTAAIHHAGISETRLAYVNAVRPDGGIETHLSLAASNCRRVVALGGTAHAVCGRLDVKVETLLRHPQWERRFNHRGDYHAQLREACR